MNLLLINDSFLVQKEKKSPMQFTDHKKQRILAIHRYFWPDLPPYATMLRAIALRWVRDGHEVHVFSTQPSYKPDANLSSNPICEELDGIKIRRINLPKNEKNTVLRIFNILFFSFACYINILFGRKYDIVMASTVPQVVLGAVCCFACRIRGSKFIYHCMDIHPEIGRISGEFSNKIVFRLLQKIDSWTCRHSHRVIILSKDMEASLHTRPESSHLEVEIINNFDLPSFEPHKQINKLFVPEKKKDVCRLIFAGNIGRFQNLEMIVEAFKKIKDPTGIELLFVGEGKAKEALKKSSGSLLNTHIFFIPHQPISVARDLISNSDMGLISLVPDIIKYAYPSKTMTYMSEGCPLFAVVEPESELASFIEKENIGLSCPPHSADDILTKFIYLIENKDKVESFKKSVLEKGKDFFDQGMVLDRWSQLIN